MCNSLRDTLVKGGVGMHVGGGEVEVGNELFSGDRMLRVLARGPRQHRAAFGRRGGRPCGGCPMFSAGLVLTDMAEYKLVSFAVAKRLVSGVEVRPLRNWGVSRDRRRSCQWHLPPYLPLDTTVVAPIIYHLIGRTAENFAM